MNKKHSNEKSLVYVSTYKKTEVFTEITENLEELKTMRESKNKTKQNH